MSLHNNVLFKALHWVAASEHLLTAISVAEVHGLGARNMGSDPFRHMLPYGSHWRLFPILLLPLSRGVCMGGFAEEMFSSFT